MSIFDSRKYHPRLPAPKLSQLEKLRLSRIPRLSTGEAVRLRAFELRTAGFAKTGLEKAITRTPWSALMMAASPSLPQDRAAAEFLFRCHIVPQFCIGSIKLLSPSAAPPPLWLFEYAAYLLAYERMCLEMVLRRAGQPQSAGEQVLAEVPRSGSGVVKLGWPPTEWFFAPGQSFSYWTSRFDAWRMAALSSFRYYHQQHCDDIGHPDQANAFASLAGYLHGKTPLPAKLFVTVHERLEQSPDFARKLFNKNTHQPQASRFLKVNSRRRKAARETEVSPLVLDTWLIEIWPLVVAENWGYPDLIRIAENKFGSAQSVFDSESKLQVRCRKLHLKLGVDRARGGRPVQSRRVMKKLPPLGLLCALIAGVGEHPESWMLGQRGLIANPNPVFKTPP